MDNFSNITKENLRYYVYGLVDSRTNEMFYVGKGKEDRVFQHEACAQDTEDETEKLNRIREIKDNGGSVKKYILRHDLNEKEAFLLESLLIDMFQYKEFSLNSGLTNAVLGHHAWDKGIKTILEVEQLYACEPIKQINHGLLMITINNTYKAMGKDNTRHPDIYEATRKSWKVNLDRCNREVDYVLSVYNGVVRAVFKPTRWYVDPSLNDNKRIMFDGIEVKDKEILDLYLNKLAPKKKKGEAMPFKYYTPANNIAELY